MDRKKLLPLASKDWPPELSHIVEDMGGNPINVQGLMANNPDLTQAWWAFRNHAVQGGTLGQRPAEIVILRVAVHMKSWYEWASHVDRARGIGMTQADIFALQSPVSDYAWSARDAVLIRAVDDLSTHHQIRSQTLTELHEHFSNEQVLDLIAIHGMYLILAGMIKTWGLELDELTARNVADMTDEVSFRRQVSASLI